jgi:hypothetical protein
MSFSQSFTQDFFSVFSGSTNNTIDFADVDSDGDNDLFTTGQDGPHLADLLINNAGVFTSVANSIAPVRFSGVAFGDLDGDTDLDLVVLGQDDVAASKESTIIYINNGSGTYTAGGTHSMTQLRSGAVALADVDGDSDLDILITGWDGGGRTIELHTNNGSATFTKVVGTTFTGVTNATLRFADVDGDSDMDLFLFGDIGGSDEVSELYLNNGSGTFTIAADTFTDVKKGDADVADVDGDGDVDVVITGFNDGDSIGALTELYLNDGSGTFTRDLVATAAFTQLSSSSVDFGDVDNDGDMDILFSGKDDNGSGVAETLIYKNNGSGVFSLLSTAITGVRSGDAKLGDSDGDGDLDVIISGWDENGRTMELWLNDTTSLGVDDAILSRVSLYPNPSNDVLYISSKESKIFDIQMFNILGKQVKQVRNTNEVNLSGLSEGTYFLKINSEGASVVKKIIKK